MTIEIQFTCGDSVCWQTQTEKKCGFITYIKFKRNSRLRLVTYYGVRVFGEAIYEISESRLLLIKITH